MGWRIGSTGQNVNHNVPITPKAKTKKHSTDVVKLHMVKLKDTRNFIQEVQTKIDKFTRSNSKTMYHARSLAEVFEKGTTLVAENEAELASCLTSASKLLQRIGDMHAEFCEELTKLVTSTTMREEYEEAKREKKKYDKSRANYDAAVLKVRSINAKKGQVNLEKLAEAEDERDRLKEVLMLEQVQTGIRLQHTLVKGLMNTAELVWAFAQTMDSHYQNCANQLVSSVPDIQASKHRLQTQVPTATAPVAAPPPHAPAVTVSDTFDHLPEYSGSMSADAIPEVSVTSVDKPAGQEPSSPNLPHRKTKDYYKFYRRSVEIKPGLLAASAPITRAGSGSFSTTLSPVQPAAAPPVAKSSPPSPSPSPSPSHAPSPTSPVLPRNQHERLNKMTRQRSFTSGSVPQRIAEQPDMLRYGPTTGNGGGSALQLRRTSARQLKTPLGSSSSPATPSVARIPPRPLELPPDVASLGLLPSGSARLQVRPRKAITVSGGNAPLLLNHPALANTNASASANGDSSEDGGSDDNDSSSGSGTTRKHSQLRSSGKSRLRNKSTLGFGLVASSRSGSAIERDASGSDRDRDTEEEERDQQSGNEPATDTADEEGVDQEAEKEWLDSFDDIPPYDPNDYDDSDDVGEVDSMASSRELTSLGPDGALSSSPQSGEFFLPPNHRKGAFLFHAIRKKRKRHSKKVTLIIDVPQVTRPSGSRKKLHLLWKLKEVPEKFIFHSSAEGERFYQAFWAAKIPRVR
ncbi:uncharacterized protein ACA1_203160 [Acanthamoeba castellanii str. Neff]|uniref:BAR domain-containing protein n=1 Tax=Acanthamoeba castellanii (strain ATCC 30010 / Neff) TaxID=1257118 RepID=L8GTQ6_ACACF|nr:uncharacterized protein ACA1_203160 [Acanthamoeba castellanii str. Neff]ELR16312.1 hypothetical protein ACA1_203160 [Acanthamoeba castellanii str. Neff]